MADTLKKFGKYFLLDLLAQGGMAEIYRARHATPTGGGRLLAIKRIQSSYSSNPEFINMFRGETKVTSSFTHPNIIQVYDYGEEQGQLYIAMEYVDGRNLRQFITRLGEIKQLFPVEVSCYVIEQSCLALQYAHDFKDKFSGKSLNIIHRDISPQNILISYDGAVKVIDFGIAKTESQAEATRAGIIKGKPSYLSPEQIMGEQLDGRSDIFALGVVFWELLTGRKLFQGDNDLAVIRMIENCQNHIKPPSALNPKIPKELDAIIFKSLEKDRNKRYQTAGEMQRALHKFLYQFAPEFNPADLSHYAKELFKKEILDDRKRIHKLNDRAEELIVMGEDKTAVGATAVAVSNADRPEDTGVSIRKQPADPLAPQAAAPSTVAAHGGQPAADNEPVIEMSDTAEQQASESSSSHSIVEDPNEIPEIDITLDEQPSAAAKPSAVLASKAPAQHTPVRPQVPQRPTVALKPEDEKSASNIKLETVDPSTGSFTAGVVHNPKAGLPSGTGSVTRPRPTDGTAQRTRAAGARPGSGAAQSSQSSSPLAKIAILALLVGGGYYYYQTELRQAAPVAARAVSSEPSTATQTPSNKQPEQQGENNRVENTQPEVADNSILLRLKIHPAGGQVLVKLNGVPIRLSQGNSFTVPLDEQLNLTIDRRGFETFQKSMVFDSRRLAGTKEWPMDIELVPSHYGYLSINTTPSAEAIIYIDGGEERIQTPFSGKRLPVGNYRIVLENQLLRMSKEITTSIEENRVRKIEERLSVISDNQ
jgi:serine/threonine-protein kinase